MCSDHDKIMGTWIYQQRLLIYKHCSYYFDLVTQVTYLQRYQERPPVLHVKFHRFNWFLCVEEPLSLFLSVEID